MSNIIRKQGPDENPLYVVVTKHASSEDDQIRAFLSDPNELKKLTGWVGQHLLDLSNAADVVQETCKTVFRKADKYTRTMPISHWIYGIARRECRRANQGRNPYRRPKEIPDEHIAQHGFSENVEIRDIIADILNSLPAHDRQLIELRLAGHSLHEIAEKTGRSYAAARKYWYRLKARLRCLLADAVLGE